MPRNLCEIYTVAEVSEMLWDEYEKMCRFLEIYMIFVAQYCKWSSIVRESNK